GQLAVAGEDLDQRRLARPVGADQRDVLAAFEPQLGVLEQRHRLLAAATTDLDARVLQLEDHAGRALRRRERELQATGVLRVALQALHLVELLQARLRLSRLRGLVAEARDEALHALDLGSLGLDRASQGQLAGGLLAP